MNYWDASALVNLFVEQAHTQKYLDLHQRDARILTAWHAVPECASAFCRLHREGLLGEKELGDLLARLENQSARWFVISSGKRLEQLTLRALRIHPLRAMDAIHLASACLARGDESAPMGFFTEDGRLETAAGKEGFQTWSPP